jgi:hypothetical protein
MMKLNRFARRKREEKGSSRSQDEQSGDRTNSKTRLRVLIEEINQRVRHAGDEAFNTSQSTQSQSQGKMQSATKNKRWKQLFSKNGRAEYANKIVPATTSQQNIPDRTRKTNRQSVQAFWMIDGNAYSHAYIKVQANHPNHSAPGLVGPFPILRKRDSNVFELNIPQELAHFPSVYRAEQLKPASQAKASYTPFPKVPRSIIRPIAPPPKASTSVLDEPGPSSPQKVRPSINHPNLISRRLSRLESLPNELLEMILLNIPPEWLYPMLRTCHGIRSALLSDLAYLWYPHPITGHTRRRPEEGYRFHHANHFITITFGMKNSTIMHAFVKYSTFDLNPFTPLSQSSLIVSGTGETKAGPARHAFSYPPIAYAEIRLDALHKSFAQYPLYVHAADNRVGITYKDIHTALRKHAQILFTQCSKAFDETTHYMFQGFEWVEETTFTIKNGWQYSVSYIRGREPNNVSGIWPPLGRKICGNDWPNVDMYVTSGYSYAGVVQGATMW